MGDHCEEYTDQILRICHPPLGSPPGNTNAIFIEDVNQLVHYFITNHNNLVILWDLNMHVQGLENLEASIYNNTIEALGLSQHILGPTHKLGNTLDVISDHKIVGI